MSHPSFALYACLGAVLLGWQVSPCPAQYSPTTYAGRQQQAKLQVATFNLAKLSATPENLEQVRAAASNTVEVVKTLLYAQGGEAAAAVQGRRYWYDANSCQLTITDYPQNLQVVSGYVRSLDMTTPGKRSRSLVTPLRHQSASDMQTMLNQAMGTSGGSTATGSAAQSVTKSVSVGGELTFRDLRLRVIRIEYGANPQLRGDGQVQMTVATSTQQAQDQTIQSYHSQFIDNYEVNVLDVRPSGNGQGSARIEVRYNPAATGTAAVTVPGAAPQAR